MLPGGTLGPSLLVAARLLVASATEFAAWSKLALPGMGSLSLAPVHLTPTDATALYNHGCSEVVRLALSFTSESRKRKREPEAYEAAPEQPVVVNAALGTADEDAVDIGTTCIASAPASVLPAAASKLLIKAIEVQLGEYCRQGIAEDEAELVEAIQSTSRCSPGDEVEYLILFYFRVQSVQKDCREEQQRARIAALTLIIGEKEILVHAMEALQARGHL